MSDFCNDLEWLRDFLQGAAPLPDLLVTMQSTDRLNSPALQGKRLAGIWFRGVTFDEFLRQAPLFETANSIVLELDEPLGEKHLEQLAGMHTPCCIFSHQAPACHLFATATERGIDLCFPITPQTLQALAADSGLTHAATESRHVSFRQETFATLHQTRARTLVMNPTTYAPLLGCSLANVPPCIVRGRSNVFHNRLWAEVFTEQGTVDFKAFTDWFITERYYIKPPECASCTACDTCRGFHINQARAGTLQAHPITE